MLLAGVRVLDFTVSWSGPLAGRYLADLGAEVIHVEHPAVRGMGHTGVGGDRVEKGGPWEWGQMPGPVFRSGVYPDADPGERPWNRQGVFNKQNRNKLSLCADLKAPGGPELLADLVRSADVVLDNFSPRGVNSMGLDDASLRAHNPDIIRVSMAGYGHTGPDTDRVSFGPILEAHTGLVWTTGYEGEGPMKMGHALPDPVAGLHGAFAVLAALEERDRHGTSGFVDLAQYETYAAIGGEFYFARSATGDEPERPGNRSPDRAPQGVYRAAGDDEWVAISVQDDDEYAALAGAVGAPDGLALDERRARHDELDAAITAWTAGRTKLEAMHELQGRGVRAVAVMTNQDIVEDEHLAARGFIVEWDQVDVGPRRFPGFPIHFERPDRIPMRGAPGLGQDNERVLTEVLGYAPERVAALAAGGVLHTRPA
jgi:crotonobetainyl-CoA:carnitine CoA-transferase CaiB-like acyl-CoA transferase